MVNATAITGVLERLAEFPVERLIPVMTAYNLGMGGVEGEAMATTALRRLLPTGGADEFQQATSVLRQRLGDGAVVYTPQLQGLFSREGKPCTCLLLTSPEVVEIVAAPAIEQEWNFPSSLAGIPTRLIPFLDIWLDDHLYEAQLAVATLLSSGNYLEPLRYLLLHLTAEALQLAPNLGSLGQREPAKLLAYAMMRGVVKAGNASLPRDQWVDWVEFDHLISPNEPDRCFQSGCPWTYLEGLCERSQAWGPYLEALYPLVDSFFAYLEECQFDHVNSSQRLTKGELRQRLHCYLARRYHHPDEGLEESALESTRQWVKYFAGARHGLSEGEIESHTHLLKERFKFFFDCLGRLIATRLELMGRFGDQIARDFPFASIYQRGYGDGPTWDQFQERFILQGLSPSFPHQGRRITMIVGIGREIELVERYARLGHDLILVDNSRQVVCFFADHASELRRMEAQYGIRIICEWEDICSPALAEKYEDQVHVVEYHNVFNFNLHDEDIATLQRVLKKGGVFCQFHPTLIQRDGLAEAGFEEVFAIDNIAAILQTHAERLAYPLGNQLLLMLKMGEVRQPSSGRAFPAAMSFVRSLLGPARPR